MKIHINQLSDYLTPTQLLIIKMQPKAFWGDQYYLTLKAGADGRMVRLKFLKAKGRADWSCADGAASEVYLEFEDEIIEKFTKQEGEEWKND